MKIVKEILQDVGTWINSYFESARQTSWKNLLICFVVGMIIGPVIAGILDGIGFPMIVWLPLEITAIMQVYITLPKYLEPTTNGDDMDES